MNLLHLTRVSANVSSDTSRFMEALLLGKIMGGKRLTEADGIGRVFGRLTVVGWAHKDKRGHQLWKCLCSCGNYITVEMQYAGKEWCLMRLCEHLGLAYPRTYKRYISRGWSLAASLDITTPDSQYETVFYKQKDSL